MKKRKTILIIGAVVCLLAVLITLGTCGGGKLAVEQAMYPFAVGLPPQIIEDTYSAHPSLQAGSVTVIADTPWGILICCHISNHQMAQWYTLDDPKLYEFTNTKDTETRWFFLRPGESFEIYVDEDWRTDDGTFWTYTNVQS